MNPAQQLLAERVREAAARGTPLRLCGGGSKNFYGQALQGEPLQLSGLTGIVSYEPSELVVTVQAGTALAELEALLATRGQYLPFEPPHFAAGGASQATCGGMVAAGLSGPARASVGAVRDYVLGVRMINGRGEDLSFGGQVMKNVAGYDVSRLMAGALGTLGILTEISLKVLPLAPAEATLRFEADQATALQRLQGWGARPLPLNASCWVRDAGTDLLFVRLRGAKAAVEAACRQMGGERMDTQRSASDWDACRNQTLPFFVRPAADGLSLWRLSLPASTPPLALAHDTLIEWHGAQRWLWARADEAARVRAAALAAGGHATLFRPAQEAQRAVGVFQPLDAAMARIQRELKKQFDPAGILNPSRLYPEF